MSHISLTQIKSPGPESKRVTQSRERKVMFRTTGFENTVEVMIMVSITHFNGRL